MSRWFSIAPVLGGLVLLGAGNARAQSSDNLLANIPFDFKVGRTTLPAGEYHVTYDAAEVPGLLIVRSQDGRHAVFVLTEGVGNRHPTRDGRLVFEREGDIYALSEVFGADRREGLEILGTTHPAD